MTISESIEKAEAMLQRGLSADEIVLVSRMVAADKTDAEIFELLDKPIEMPEDDAGETFRYEATGDRVIPIPQGQPDVDEEPTAVQE